jgi:hypothetical protein
MEIYFYFIFYLFHFPFPFFMLYHFLVDRSPRLGKSICRDQKTYFGDMCSSAWPFNYGLIWQSFHDHCHNFDAFSPFRPKLCVDSIIRIKHGWWKLSAWSGLQRRSILLHISCSRTNLPWHTLGPWTLQYILFMSRHGCMYLRVRVRITII